MEVKIILYFCEELLAQNVRANCSWNKPNHQGKIRSIGARNLNTSFSESRSYILKDLKFYRETLEITYPRYICVHINI